MILFNLPAITPLPLFALSLLRALICAMLGWRLVESRCLAWVNGPQARSIDDQKSGSLASARQPSAPPAPSAPAIAERDNVGDTRAPAVKMLADASL